MVFANILGFTNPVEVTIVAVVVMVLFGASKVGEFGKSLGEGLKEFKKAARDEPDASQQTIAAPPSVAVDAMDKPSASEAVVAAEPVSVSAPTKE
jgi:sec-independent protein translocase protein TatA